MAVTELYGREALCLLCATSKLAQCTRCFELIINALKQTRGYKIGRGDTCRRNVAPVVFPTETQTHTHISGFECVRT